MEERRPHEPKHHCHPRAFQTCREEGCGNNAEHQEGLHGQRTVPVREGIGKEPVRRIQRRITEKAVTREDLARPREQLQEMDEKVEAKDNAEESKVPGGDGSRGRIHRCWGVRG